MCHVCVRCEELRTLVEFREVTTAYSLVSKFFIKTKTVFLTSCAACGLDAERKKGLEGQIEHPYQQPGVLSRPGT